MKKTLSISEAISLDLLYIAESAVVAETVRIEAIEDDGISYGRIEIGANSIIREYAILCSGCSIGVNTLIGHGTVIRRQVKIGNNVVISHHVSIEKNSVIGDKVRISAKTHITGDCTIEDDVQIGAGVMTINDKELKFGSNPTLIAPVFRRGCKVGSGSTIMSAIEIGENTLVGAGSLVLKNLPKNIVAFGVPAKIQRERTSE